MYRIEARHVGSSATGRNTGGASATNAMTTTDNLVLSDKHDATGDTPHVLPSKRKLIDLRHQGRTQ